jgi:SSS family solute:Na+ symporter
MIYGIIIAYLVLSFASGFIGYKKAKDTPEDYFLASRNIGSIVLFFTFIATNFSAFFFLGFAGQGYKLGYAYYAMMSLGTAIASLAFYLIGHKMWTLGKTHGFITTTELIGSLSKSKTLQWIYLIITFVFTIPYMALQPMGAGYILNELTGGTINYEAGAILLTAFIVIYVFVGGMRSVAITDLKQGILMFVFMFLALYVIAGGHGGFIEANEKVFSLKPELFKLTGSQGQYSLKKWFSLMLLWLFCVPMFPQMMMRYFVSKDLQSLKTASFLYAAIPLVLFLFPVAIGVIGHLSYPDPSQINPDQILPKLLMIHSPEWLAALILTGAMAAFMSTMDSQLLALSTLLTRDVYLRYLKPEASLKEQVWVGKILIIIIAIVGLLLAFNAPSSIFDFAKHTFTGFAIMFPTVLCLLHIKGIPNWAYISSLIIGEGLFLGFFIGWIPQSLSFGFELIIPIIFVSTITLLIGYKLDKRTTD